MDEVGMGGGHVQSDMAAFDCEVAQAKFRAVK